MTQSTKQMKLRNKIGQWREAGIWDKRFKLSPKVIIAVILMYAVYGLYSVTITLQAEGSKLVNEITSAKTKVITNTQANPPVDEDGGKGTEQGTEELHIAEFSAYTSDPAETDDSPFETASGLDLSNHYECVVASNDYEFGTRLAIEDIGVCSVEDRMNSRYTGTGNIDVYFGTDKQRALNFGRKELSYIVIE